MKYFPYAIVSAKDGRPFLWYTYDSCLTMEEALKSIKTVRTIYTVYHAWVEDNNKNVIHAETYVDSMGKVNHV